MRNRCNPVSVSLGLFLLACSATPLEVFAGDAVGYDWDENVFRYCWSPDPPDGDRYSTSAECIAMVQHDFADSRNHSIIYNSDLTHFVAFAGGYDREGRVQIAIGSGSTQYDAQQDAYRQLKGLKVDYYTLYGSYFSNGSSEAAADSGR